MFVLNIEMVLPISEPEEPELGVVPDDDPKRLKNILSEMEAEDYLRNDRLAPTGAVHTLARN